MGSGTSKPRLRLRTLRFILLKRSSYFPRDSPSRESKSLDGLWNFKTSPKVKKHGAFSTSEAILFPRDSPSRESKSLDGLWNFKTSPKVKTLCFLSQRPFSFPETPPSESLRARIGSVTLKPRLRKETLHFFLLKR
jgi:hypothetical protein